MVFAAFMEQPSVSLSIHHKTYSRTFRFLLCGTELSVYGGGSGERGIRQRIL